MKMADATPEKSSAESADADEPATQDNKESATGTDTAKTEQSNTTSSAEHTNASGESKVTDEKPKRETDPSATADNTKLETPTTSTSDPTSASASSNSPSADTDPSQSTTVSPKTYSKEDQMVLDYLNQQGMLEAAKELTRKLDAKLAQTSTEKASTTSPVSTGNDNKEANDRNKKDDGDDMDIDDSNNNQTDEDKNSSEATATTTNASDATKDKSPPDDVPAEPKELDPAAIWGVPDEEAVAVLAKPDPNRTERARHCLNAFVEYQSWVLSLPDHSLLFGNDDNEATAVSDDDQQTPTPETNNDCDSTSKLPTPPSVKPELMAVGFALFVYTHTEVLTVGMESTAQMLRETFVPIFRTLYPDETRDLTECTETKDIVRLNTNLTEYVEGYMRLKAIADQVTKYVGRRDQALSANDKKKCDAGIALMTTEYHRRAYGASSVLSRLQDMPLLERNKLMRWVLSLSTATYATLVEHFQLDDPAKLALWTVLNNKCILQVESREPLSYSPGYTHLTDRDGSATSNKDGKILRINQLPVSWGAPAPRPEIDTRDEVVPFPKYHLKEEYDSSIAAARDERTVKFNRALLMNGFRRLDALERKRDFHAMTPLAQKRARRGEEIPASDPLEPSILLTTLSASSAPTHLVQELNRNIANSDEGGADINSCPSIWEEPGIGICCTKVSHVGEYVAVGCDDAAVRVYSLQKGGEPGEVLLGHKQGFPVFDVDWNRDGRTLLSAGGDGTVRLWDVEAVGPFGELTTPKDNRPSSKSSPEKKKGKQIAPKRMEEDTEEQKDMPIPGWRGGEPVAYTSGAALAVYTTETPVWSVSFAPCGYYFCTSGSDATAQLWTTDRPEPVRMFSGHLSANVNCVGWHPNANYIITGSDDKTARLWDIQTGQTVRLLTGCNAGINQVRISPGGRYCAGADYSGVVHLWDLDSGKKISAYLPETVSVYREQRSVSSIAFSACGSALAVGSDDCCVRLWDIQSRSESLQRKPSKCYPTRRTVVMDLAYTRRNLLLGVGKYVTPVPIVSAVEDE